MPLAGSLTKGKVQRASTCTAPWLTLTEPQKIKGIATETCMNQEEEEGPRGHQGSRQRGRVCLRSSLASRVESRREGALSWLPRGPAHRRPGVVPINASTLLRFKRGNVLFISHPTGETWQPLDGSDPKGILVTNGCPLLPLYCGCSNSKRPKVTGSKREGESPFLPFTVFMRMWTFDNKSWRV